MKRHILLVVGIVLLAACGRFNGKKKPASSFSEVRIDDSPVQHERDLSNEDLTSDEAYRCGAPAVDFAKNVWRPLIKEDCFGCHIEGGYADQRGSELTFVGTQDPNYLIENRLRLRTMKDKLLKKVDGTEDHLGGVIYKSQSAQHTALGNFVNNTAPSFAACAPSFDLGLTKEEGGAYAMQAPERLLQKVSVSLLARLPTAAEQAEAKSKGIDGVMSVLDRMLNEETFYEWLAEAYNDVLFTDSAIHYFGPGAPFRIFPNYNYFEKLPKDSLEMKTAAKGATFGVGREALELIKHVARNNKPFTEIVTADYMMMNPMSAPIYLGDSPGLTFKNPNDPHEFVPAVAPAMKGHAGVLTSFIVLQVYSTTDSNRNRARAKAIYDIFLDTKILQLGMRSPTDLVNLPDSQTPTMTSADCLGCHTLIDPIASAYQNYRDDGSWWNREYQPWPTDMFQAGFEGRPVDPGEANPVVWLGKQIAKDPRFVRATVHRIFTALVGAPPLEEPAADAVDYEEQLRAFVTQRQVLEAIGETFVGGGYNIKTVVKEVIKTPYYRAKGINPAAPAYAEALLGEGGAGHRRSPEALHRIIKATTGLFLTDVRKEPMLWPGPSDVVTLNGRFLSYSGVHNVLLGGIDSRLIKVRAAGASAVIAKAEQNLAKDVSCKAVAHDFMLPKQERVMMPLVEPTYMPTDPAHKDAIIKNIVHLHSVLLNEDVAPNDPSVSEAFDLLVAARQKGFDWMKQNGGNQYVPWGCRVTHFDDLGRGPNGSKGTPFQDLGSEDKHFGNDPQYIIRGWVAVVNSLLGDFRFFYE